MSELFAWHQDAWQTLKGKVRAQGHALLINGERGIGKWIFVDLLARALLCERPTEQGFACHHCDGCLWLNSHNHPDYHLLIAPAQRALWGIEDAETDDKKSDEKKKPSKDIDVNQVRGLVSSIYTSPHTSQGRVIVVAPAESMNAIAANALLKTLEEPPANTIFLLLSHQIHHLLPTIISRCTQLALRAPTQEEALNWLHSKKLEQHTNLLAAEAYCPVALLQRLEKNPGYAVFLEQFLHVLAHPESPHILDMAAELSKYETLDIIQVVQKWMTDVCLLQHSDQLRYFPQQRAKLKQLTQRTETARTELFLRELLELRRMSEHTLAPRLFVENLLLRYKRVFI